MDLPGVLIAVVVVLLMLLMPVLLQVLLHTAGAAACDGVARAISSLPRLFGGRGEGGARGGRRCCYRLNCRAFEQS